MPVNRRNYYALMNRRAGYLAAAEEAMNRGDTAELKAQMAKAKELDPQLDDMNALMAEQDRYDREHAPKFGTGARDLEEMGRALRAHEAVRFNVGELLTARRDSVTVATGSIVAPVGAGTEIRDGFAGQVSGLIDLVNTVDFTGLSAVEEPYVISEMAAQGGKVTTTAGTARTASDPTFGKAKIAPHEVTTTSYVDRNLRRLSNAGYATKVQSMALRALRRKVNGLIVNGDGASSPDMFGITTAKNTGGTAIFDTQALGTAIGIDTLNTLIYAYGGSEELGGSARLVITKQNLQNLCKLRGTNEKRNLFRCIPDAGNANSGVIDGDGLVVPYTIASDIGDAKIGYGDPMNYELALFGDYVIRLDESYKAGERLDTILGDVFVGGNLVVDKGFVIGTIGG